MVRKHTWIACVVSIFGLGACQNTHEQQASFHEQHEQHETPVAARPATTLASAIEIAQKNIPDGRFLKAEIEEEDGKTICSVILASGDGQREVNVDVASGAILATENEKLDADGSAVLALLAKDPTHAPIGATQAIEAALAKAPGSWALAADLSQEEDGLVYFVVLRDGTSAKIAQVSAADGKVQKVSTPEEDDEDDEGMEEHETPPAKPK